jgi:hypothetical protein
MSGLLSAEDVFIQSVTFIKVTLKEMGDKPLLVYPNVRIIHYIYRSHLLVLEWPSSSIEARP